MNQKYLENFGVNLHAAFTQRRWRLWLNLIQNFSIQQKSTDWAEIQDWKYSRERKLWIFPSRISFYLESFKIIWITARRIARGKVRRSSENICHIAKAKFRTYRESSRKYRSSRRTDVCCAGNVHVRKTGEQKKCFSFS